MKDETPIDIQASLTMQASGELTIGAKLVKHWLAHASHDAHVQYDIDAIGQFDADPAKG